eukprot:gene25149-biopygen88799
MRSRRSSGRPPLLRSPAEVKYDLTWTTHKTHFIDDLADALANLTQAALRSAWAKANLTRCASAAFYVVACRNPKLKDRCRAAKEELPVASEEFDDGVEELLCRGERGEAHVGAQNEERAVARTGRTPGRAAPRVLYIGTATYDAVGPMRRQTSLLSARGCAVAQLRVADAAPKDATEAAAAVAAADVIVVSGAEALLRRQPALRRRPVAAHGGRRDAAARRGAGSGAVRRQLRTFERTQLPGSSGGREAGA